jgi:hypothetical protein
LATINKLRNCSVTVLFSNLHMERASVGNLSFELEVTSDAAGDREITSIECEPTTEEAENMLEASELEEDTWQFRFVVAEEFDGTEPMFMRFKRYQLDPETVFEACRAAAGPQD